ncbi:hypothetical protein AFK69_07900 [Xenorhabdus sp. GDc328]|uniref:putative sulfate exporter family transporter n=1 Tax=Xenorhabdus sp. GDc328 TaxID=742178 RepID=UPI00064995DE|nr:MULTISPECIES: putative sulfate exporter family transporter [Xenorhabdus]KLU15594.1 hypothetical protein AAY47_09735 [Xenorhabdus griffiniae]KOP33862.1 hypothetical protein AFK69_07900 [Xenorhabdus sp. GDc328]WFQ80120.1 putative sulfate exporter family transporter [Xenorhabdus sp. SF857]
MSENQPGKLTKAYPNTTLKLIPGLILVAVLTALAIYIGTIPWFINMGLGVLTLAILLGMVIGNTLYPPLKSTCDSGIHFSKHYLLRAGIILYGFRLTFQQITDVGATGILIDTIMLAMAMIALGLTTHISAIRQAGVKPILLALILFVWLVAGGLIVNQGIHHLLR